MEKKLTERELLELDGVTEDTLAEFDDAEGEEEE